MLAAYRDGACYAAWHLSHDGPHTEWCATGCTPRAVKSGFRSAFCGVPHLRSHADCLFGPSVSGHVNGIVLFYLCLIRLHFCGTCCLLPPANGTLFLCSFQQTCLRQGFPRVANPPTREFSPSK